jgi:hypothetical protein
MKIWCELSKGVKKLSENREFTTSRQILQHISKNILHIWIFSVVWDLGEVDIVFIYKYQMVD